MASTSLNAADLRQLDKDGIRGFVLAHSEHLRGRVLDYGCGLSPYVDIVRAAGGTYHPFDRASFPANVTGEDVGSLHELEALIPYDAVLCNQVLQYQRDPYAFIDELAKWLGHGGLSAGGGKLVITGPTTWPIVEAEDLVRFTLNGITEALDASGFDLIAAQETSGIHVGAGVNLAIGWGCVGVRR